MVEKLINENPHLQLCREDQSDEKIKIMRIIIGNSFQICKLPQYGDNNELGLYRNKKGAIKYLKMFGDGYDHYHLPSLRR